MAERDDYNEIYAECFEPVLRYARRLAGSKEEAKDLTQEAFSRAWRVMQEGGNLAPNPCGWLCTTARNEFYWNRKKRMPLAPRGRETDIDPIDTVPSPQPSVEYGVEQLEDRRLRDEHLEGIKVADLTHKQLKIFNFVLEHGEETRLTSDQIALALGMSAENVRTQKSHYEFAAGVTGRYVLLHSHLQAFQDRHFDASAIRRTAQPLREADAAQAAL